MRSYKLYAFDLDDTLIYTFENVTKNHYHRLAERLGFPHPSKDAIRQHWGEELFASLKAIFGPMVDESKAIVCLQEEYQKSPIEPISGVHHMLDIMRKHNKFIGMYSSGHPSLMELSIHNSLSCNKMTFDLVLSTIEQKIAKPSPHIVFMMMEKYRHVFGHEVELDQVLVVGDSVSDLLVARNAGVDFAAVLTGATTKNDFLCAGLGFEWIFSSIKEAMTPPLDHSVVAVIRNRKNEYLLVKEARPDNPYLGHWSGPHGRCKSKDVLEEETVVRETQEECGVAVRPLRKLYTRHADTKVSTVSFWEAELLDPEVTVFNTSRSESDAIGWFPLGDITEGKVPLYLGTEDFFDQYVQHLEVAEHGRDRN